MCPVNTDRALPLRKILPVQNRQTRPTLSIATS